MKKIIILIGMWCAINAQAMKLGDSNVLSPGINQTSSSVSRFTKTAKTLGANPIKPNEFVKSSNNGNKSSIANVVKPSHTLSSNPVASMNAPSPASACEEKKEVQVAIANCSK